MDIITGKILKLNDWPDGKIIGLAKDIGNKLIENGMERDAVLAQLEAVRQNPGSFLADSFYADLARECIRTTQKDEQSPVDLRESPLPFPIWGREQIDPEAIKQMENAMRLPVTVTGALMPDAHVGYGLPIGGVLATDNVVIPYAVGVDIACFSGDTMIPLLDGNNYTLEELANRAEAFHVYACKPDGKIIVAPGAALKTRENAELVEVIIDNGEKIHCTPDHEFMLRDGTYRRAIDLSVGESLMPFYSQIDQEGYVRIQQNYSGRWQRAHWMVARSGLLGDIPRFEGQRVIVHHKDFNEANNDPPNLEFMGNKDHSTFHRSLTDRNTHWQSKDFEQRRKEALSAKAQTEQGYRYFAARGGKNLKTYWERDYERAKANCAGNGQRGKPYLIARNISEKGRALSKEIAARIHTCDICGEQVKSYIGLYNHRRLTHGVTGKLHNHKVISVRHINERRDVYCLVVPEYNNFALSVGIFVHNCRMRLSIYEVSPHLIGQKKGMFEDALWNETAFGMGVKWTGSKRAQHAVLDDEAWNATRQLQTLKDIAYGQLGTSGTGNHFVEWGSFRLHEEMFGLRPGEYLALLSHSGSRGVGAKIADRYSKLAMEKHPDLDKSARHLAWLSLDSEDGQEYWLAMELAGRFASANHYIIHHRVAAAVGLKEAAVVENHHNYAWVEKLTDGRNVIVHRKGATPAGAGVLGVIPGSMGDAGYVVRGRGVSESLDSASHGAGRQMSRKAALNSISRRERDDYLKEHGVTLLGGGIDESPQAYKPIDTVIAAQHDLVDVIGKFTPRIVRMADEPGDI
ncbi:MAG TPA: RtcB family protein [Anaerolineales bacterium]|nr:RtcB family protein [Anaerolineales bacterium]